MQLFGWEAIYEGGSGSEKLLSVEVPIVIRVERIYRGLNDIRWYRREGIMSGRFWWSVGIVSWGEGCARDGYPGAAYTPRLTNLWNGLRIYCPNIRSR